MSRLSSASVSVLRGNARRNVAGEIERRVAGLLGDMLEELGVPESDLDERRLMSAAHALRHFTQGYARRPEEIIGDALFDDAGEEPVIVRDIPFVSMCGEHLLPFHGQAHVAYLPGASVVGLSKLARFVDLYAQRLQTPSRLADNVAQAVLEGLEAKGVAVRIEARQVCPGVSGTVISQVYLGAFKEPSWWRRLEGFR